MLGSALKKSLTSVGITNERVTKFGYRVGYLEAGEDCGCDKRVEAIDRLTYAGIDYVKGVLGMGKKKESEQVPQAPAEPALAYAPSDPAGIPSDTTFESPPMSTVSLSDLEHEVINAGDYKVVKFPNQPLPWTDIRGIRIEEIDHELMSFMRSTGQCIVSSIQMGNYLHMLGFMVKVFDGDHNKV
jgi:hypothetical protein